MRRALLFLFVLSLSLPLFAQQRAVVSKDLRNKAQVKESKAVKFTANQLAAFTPGTKTKSILSDDQIGQTLYDLQSNVSCQNRLYMHEDGTIAGVWTMGFEAPGFSNDRGTGYNYHNGNSWGPEPTVRIEDEWTGWSSYAPYGENGELVVNHTYVDGLWVGIREEKGSGDWEYNILGGPSGAEDISWPRAITSGIDNSIIHTLSVTYVTYNGQANALLYSRSMDGGETWDPENQILEDFGPDNYTNMGGDIYDWADSKDGNIAFLAGEGWTDLVLMKSSDDGNTWEKTIVWECPYPLNAGLATDTFYCADGSHHLAFDNSGKVHVVFGINRANSDGSTQYWYPFVDGVVYWNEDMPAFSDHINALSPYGDEGSELVEDYNLIGWSQDLNGNGELDILDDVGTYYLGLSSMVQIIVDELNQIFVIYSSVTENYDNGDQSYRHLWTRSSPDGGNSWGPFYHLNEDLSYIFDECVFPSVSPTSDENNIYILYQADAEPGMAVRGDMDPYGDNFIRVMTVLKEDIIDGVGENRISLSEEDVSQNSPNPSSYETEIHVNLKQKSILSLDISNLAGKKVFTIPSQNYSRGIITFHIPTNLLSSGIYFYTIRSKEKAITKKMIIN